jgi:hypothetical protein
VIERSVILAEGDDSAAILTWISDHDGVADSTAALSPRSTGLHARLPVQLRVRRVGSCCRRARSTNPRLHDRARRERALSQGPKQSARAA